MKKAIGIAGACFVALTIDWNLANAQIGPGPARYLFINPAISFMTKDVEDEDESRKFNASLSTTTINLTLGVNAGAGFLLGVKYYSEIEDNTTKVIDLENDASEKLQSVGVSVGYNWEFIWTFVSWMGLQPPERETNEGKTVLDRGGGFGFDLAALFGTPDFSAGPQLSYFNFEYERRTTEGDEDDSFKGRVENHLKPLFAFVVSF